MRMNAEDKKKAIAGGVFALLAAGILFYQLHDDSSPAPVAPVAVTAPTRGSTVNAPVAVVPSGSVGGHAAKNVGTASALLDPTLKMGPMLVTEALVYSGSGKEYLLGDFGAGGDADTEGDRAGETGAAGDAGAAADGAASASADRPEVLRDGYFGEWAPAGVSAARGGCVSGVGWGCCAAAVQGGIDRGELDRDRGYDE